MVGAVRLAAPGSVLCRCAPRRAPRGRWRALATSSAGAAPATRATRPFIHESALVGAGAQVGEGCEIGPFCVVSSGARLGRGTRLHAHATVLGDAELGSNCEVHSFAVVGGASQDRKHAAAAAAAAESRLAGRSLCVGRDVVFREYVSVNGGTAGGTTFIGDGVLLLAGCHVGHDCVVEDGVVVSNAVQLAGHVHVGRQAVLGGACAVRQFVRIGRLAMVGGASAVDGHVPPFSLVQGNRARLHGLNLVGLRRRGVPAPDVRSLRAALAHVARPTALRPTLRRRVEAVAADPASSPMVHELCSFLLYESGDLWSNRNKALGHLLQ